ncbi:MAG: M28 family peptidase, partial [Chloroflexota bacterium]
DNLAGKGAGICYVSREGMLLPLKASPELLSIANEIAEEFTAERADLKVYAREFTTLHTDGSVFMLSDIPTISFLGLTPEGALPDWHQASDTFDRVDPKAVEAVETFVLGMLRRMDRS